MRKKEGFNTKDLALMVIFAAIGGSFMLTTFLIRAMIPIPVPGFGGIVAIPLSTAFLLIAVGLVRRLGSATFTSTIMGVVEALLPGPGILVLPASILTGIVVDSFLWAIRRNVDDSRIVAASTAFMPTLFTTWFMWWGFRVLYGLTIPLIVFAAIFIGLHGVLMIIGGLAAYSVLKRVQRMNALD
ncbi:MAG: MptD family putative ECF transporter S component [Candidatus Odinarchaeia archaeon]